MKINNYLQQELGDLVTKDSALFDFIQNTCLDGLWYWDLQNPEHEWMNARFWEVLGYDPETRPHSPDAWQEIVNQADLAATVASLDKHLEDEQHAFDEIVRYRHKNGSTVWIRCQGKAVRDEQGKPLRMLGVHKDVTADKNAEQEYQKLAERLALATESAGIGIWDYDVASDRLEWDDGMFSLLGADPAQFSHQFDDFARHLVGDSLQETVTRFQAALASGTTFESTIRIRRGDDGTLRTLDGRGRVIRNNAGEAVRVVGVNSDITDEEDNRNRLAAEEAKFRGLFEFSPVGIAMTDFNTGEFLEFNKALIASTGYTREEFKALS